MMALGRWGACPLTPVKIAVSYSFLNQKTPDGLAEPSDSEVSRVQIRVAMADGTADL